MPSTDSSAEPNPARDARRRVRAERERRRAARALDRYMEIYEQAVAGAGGTLPILTAGERFVEAVGDYVLSELHHNGDYGVAPEFAPDQYVTTVTRPCECDRPDRDGPHPRMGSCAAREMENSPQPKCPVCGEQAGHSPRCPEGGCVAPPLRVTDESAMHVPHLHSVGDSPCRRIECHTLGIGGTPCVFCGGQPCRVVLS